MYSHQQNIRGQNAGYHSWNGKEKPQVHFTSDKLNIKDKKCLTEARKTLAAARKSSVFPPVQDPIYTLSILTSLHSLANARLSGE